MPDEAFKKKPAAGGYHALHETAEELATERRCANLLITENGAMVVHV